ncbi:hypothetical protein MHBO_002280, partial [Bonamia ostreae]
MDWKETLRFLLDKDKLNFSIDPLSTAVSAYRAKSASHDYAKLIFNNYQKPKQTSRTEIRPGTTSCQCFVTLDRSIDQSGKTVIIDSDATTTASDLIYGILERIGKTDDKSDFILKASKMNEYIENDEILWNSAYPRSMIKQNKIIELRMLAKSKISKKIFETNSEKGFKDYKNLAIKSDFKKVLSGRDFNVAPNADVLKMDYIPFRECNFPFSVKILGVDNIKTPNKNLNDSICVKTFLFFGNKIIKETNSKTVYKKIQPKFATIWNERIGFANRSIKINRLPRSTKAAFLVCSKRLTDRNEIVAWIVVNLINEWGQMLSKKQKFNLWTLPMEVEHIFTAPTGENVIVNDNSKPTICVEFPEFILPVLSPKTIYYHSNGRADSIIDKRMNIVNEERLKQIYTYPLMKLTEEDQSLVWLDRNNIRNNFQRLKIFLKCIDWTNPHETREARKIFMSKKRPKHIREMISLLDYPFHDTLVRKETVKILYSLTDEEINCYLIQLVQALKFEQYHNSTLSQFLIRKAIKNPLQIGQAFFWNLKTELSDLLYSQRYYLILEEYLYKTGANCYF